MLAQSFWRVSPLCIYTGKLKVDCIHSTPWRLASYKEVSNMECMQEREIDDGPFCTHHSAALKVTPDQRHNPREIKWRFLQAPAVVPKKCCKSQKSNYVKSVFRIMNFCSRRENFAFLLRGKVVKQRESAHPFRKSPQNRHPKRKDPALEGGISKHCYLPHISAVAQVEIGNGKKQK